MTPRTKLPLASLQHHNRVGLRTVSGMSETRCRTTGLYDKTCSQEVERLLRQGRKYGLGGCIATQRIANLNTNALQQLHTYFVSTMPRPYDRGLVSNTFMIDKTILEKTLEFVPGEWLLSSYLATGMANVPIFIKADNAEKEVSAFIEKT
jgi:hypothetical protein